MYFEKKLTNLQLENKYAKNLVNLALHANPSTQTSFHVHTA